MTSKRNIRRRLDDLATDGESGGQTITIRHHSVDENGEPQQVVRESTYEVDYAE